MGLFRKYVRGANQRLKSYSAVCASKLRRNIVAAGWYNVANFGDQLTPELLRYFGLWPIHTPLFKFAEVVGVGSIIHLIPKDFSGVVLGSGLIKDGGPLHFPKTKFFLVRGKLTRERLGLPVSVPVGDPGLIVDKVYAGVIKKEKRWDAGIVPHYKDSQNDFIKKISLESIGINIKIIDVRRRPEEVVKEIAECACIFSSSLHGLVVADSLGIPNRWIKFSSDLIGGNFKFHDYYSCFDIERAPLEILEIAGHEKVSELLCEAESISHDLVDKIKRNIHSAYVEFRDAVLK
jgi:pyruvyltransferase